MSIEQFIASKKQNNTVGGIDQFIKQKTQEAELAVDNAGVAKPRKSRLSEMLDEPEPEPSAESPVIDDQKRKQNAMVASRQLESMGVPQKSYIDKIGLGEVSPIDPLARGGEALGTAVAKTAETAVKGAELVPGVTEGREEFSRQAQAVGDFFNLNKYLPENLKEKIASGVAGASEIKDFLTSNEFVNLAVKDAMDASNVAPAMGAARLGKQAIINPLEKVGGAATRAGVKQVTGLTDDTIDTLSEGGKFLDEAKSGGITRESLGETVEKAIKGKTDDLSETGFGYEEVRNLDIKIKNPLDEIDELLTNKGLSVDESGKLIEAQTLDSNLSPTDISQIQKAKDVLAPVDELNPNQVLNLRNKLDDLAGFESGTTTKGKEVIKGIRAIVDKKAKAEIPNLGKLDAKYSEQIKELKAIKRDFVDKTTGKLKDNAFTKVANATNKGKEKLLGRLEEISPGITGKIKALKTIEELDTVLNKPGTYVRAGTAMAGTVSGNPALIALAVASQPQVAAKLISGWGKLGRGAKGAKDATTTNLIKALESGKTLTKSQIKTFDEFLNAIATGNILIDNTVDSEENNDQRNK